DTGGKLVDEHYRFTPGARGFTSEYERTKWLAHYDVAEPLIAKGLPLVIVQPALVYGPGDNSLVGQSMRQYLQRRLPAAPQGATFCWAYVDDTAHGHLLAMERGRIGESYILAGPTHSMIEALLIAEKITGIPAPRLRPPVPVMTAAARVVSAIERVAHLPVPQNMTAESLRAMLSTYMADDSKARRELGWTTRPLEAGLRETLEAEMAQLRVKG
ncbi:MAG: NAD-dependent epimerase/dehydratase family protein, partial [Chloroflexaceae bacterium]|nr:NAD-dependent epimerase/dehydratase family protein [Chloroflexaceae bacterium]